jgi:hypothetical protein
MNTQVKRYIFFALPLIACGIFTIIGCQIPIPPVSATGTANVVIKLGKIGMLTKRSSIEMEHLVIQILDKEKNSIIVNDTSDLRGFNEITINKIYGELNAPVDFLMIVNSVDTRGKIIHQGTAEFSTIPGDTIDVPIDLNAEYSVLKVSFNNLPENVSKIELGIAGVDTLDSSFAAPNHDSCVVLEYNYLKTDTTGIEYSISLRASGIFYGLDTVLYAADTIVFTKSGFDTSYTIVLKWIGPDIPHGTAAIAVTIGSTGITRIDAGFDLPVFEQEKSFNELLGKWVGYQGKDSGWVLTLWKDNRDSLSVAYYGPDGEELYKGRVITYDTKSIPCKFESIIEESSVKQYEGTTVYSIYTLQKDTLLSAATEPGSGIRPASFTQNGVRSFLMIRDRSESN